MKRALRSLFLLVIAAAAGWGTSELLYQWHASRALLGRLLHHEPADATLENLQRASKDEAIADSVIDQELDLLRHQFADENAFRRALKSSGSSVAALRAELAAHLRARQWIEKAIAPETSVTEAECRDFYDAAPEHFAQPERFRLNHLFLAAPPGTPPEAIAARRGLIQGLSIRLLGGESFDALVAEVSEDEATKVRGGDLGYLSALRVPPDFMAEVEKLRSGELSGPVQSRLGFHILQSTDHKPARQLAFDEVEAEIANALANIKRAAAVTRLTAQINRPEFERAAH